MHTFSNVENVGKNSEFCVSELFLLRSNTKKEGNVNVAGKRVCGERRTGYEIFYCCTLHVSAARAVVLKLTTRRAYEYVEHTFLEIRPENRRRVKNGCTWRVAKTNAIEIGKNKTRPPSPSKKVRTSRILAVVPS